MNTLYLYLSTFLEYLRHHWLTLQRNGGILYGRYVIEMYGTDTADVT